MRARFLLDSGAGLNLVAGRFLDRLPTDTAEHLAPHDVQHLQDASGRPMGSVTRVAVHQPIVLDEFDTLLSFGVSETMVSGLYDAILGAPFFRAHHVDLDCATGTVSARGRSMGHLVSLTTNEATTVAGVVNAASIARAEDTTPIPASLATFDFAQRALSGRIPGVHEFYLVTGGTFLAAPAAHAAREQRTLVAAVSDGGADFQPRPHPGFSDERRARLTAQMERDGMLGALPPLDPNHPLAMRIDEEPGSRPCFQQPRRLAPSLNEALRQQLDKLLADGRIVPSRSPYAAPILTVRKKDGSLRLCIDYRILNSRTLGDRFPLPTVQDCLDKLYGCSYFTTLDLA